jgi:hypothetical protein
MFVLVSQRVGMVTVVVKVIVTEFLNKLRSAGSKAVRRHSFEGNRNAKIDKCTKFKK